MKLVDVLLILAVIALGCTVIFMCQGCQYRYALMRDVNKAIHQHEIEYHGAKP